MKYENVLKNKIKKRKALVRRAYLLLRLLQARFLFSGRRSILAFDSCLSQLASLCVWLLPLNPFNLQTFWLKLAFRLSCTSQAVFRLGLRQVCVRCSDSETSHFCPQTNLIVRIPPWGTELFTWESFFLSTSTAFIGTSLITLSTVFLVLKLLYNVPQNCYLQIYFLSFFF